MTVGLLEGLASQATTGLASALAAIYFIIGAISGIASGFYRALSKVIQEDLRKTLTDGKIQTKQQIAEIGRRRQLTKIAGLGREVGDSVPETLDSAEGAISSTPPIADRAAAQAPRKGPLEAGIGASAPRRRAKDARR